jgi:hypothetical protein
MKKTMLIKIITAVSYVLMVVINILANVLPFNDRTTGEISNLYPNLFAPTALTFSIWGLIYLVLGVYVLYQFGLFQKNKGRDKNKLFLNIDLYFIITCLANILWTFCWHYDFIGLSVICIIILLLSLIKIALILKKEKFSFKEELFMAMPFYGYFGWITVATIANIAVFLVSVNWNGFGLAENYWTVIMLIIGTIVGSIVMIREKTLSYGIVLIWAYLGIWLKHVSHTEFNSRYPEIVITTIVCIAPFLIIEGYLLCKKYDKRLR